MESGGSIAAVSTVVDAPRGYDAGIGARPAIHSTSCGAGSGRARKNPCISSQLSISRTWRWKACSTPSATTRYPRSPHWVCRFVAEAERQLRYRGVLHVPLISHPVDALREMARVLRPGGVVLFTDWCGDYLACRVCTLYLRLTNRAF